MPNSFSSASLITSLYTGIQGCSFPFNHAIPKIRFLDLQMHNLFHDDPLQFLERTSMLFDASSLDAYLLLVFVPTISIVISKNEYQMRTHVKYCDIFRFFSAISKEARLIVGWFVGSP